MAQNKIVTINDAKKIAQKINQNTAQVAEEKQSIFEDLFSKITEVNPAFGGFDELAVLLTLQEDHFAIIAPVFLEEL